MRSLSTLSLAAANLSSRPGRTIALALIVALFTFALMAGTLIVAHLEAGISSLSARMGADLLVVPQGEGKKMENVLLRAEPSSFYLPQTIEAAITNVPGIEKNTAQLFISSLDAQCCTVKVQLIGIDQKTDFVVSPWLAKSLQKPLADDEVIIGSFLFAEVGSTLSFYGKNFRVAAQLDPTGMGFDASVFMTLRAARKLAETAMPQKSKELAHSISAVLVRVDPHTDPMTVSDGILDALGPNARINFVYASRLMADTSAKLDRFIALFTGCALFLWVLALFLIFLVFFYAYNERKQEFALLRTLGATKSKLIGVILTESVTLGVAGTLAGLGLGTFVAVSFSHLIAQTLGLPALTPAKTVWIATALLTATAGLITCPLASLQCIWSIASDRMLHSKPGGLA